MKFNYKDLEKLIGKKTFNLKGKTSVHVMGIFFEIIKENEGSFNYDFINFSSDRSYDLCTLTKNHIITILIWFCKLIGIDKESYCKKNFQEELLQIYNTECMFQTYINL